MSQPWLAIPLGCLLATAAAAQDTYTLSEDDTWTLASTPDPATPQGQLALAQRALAANDHERAYDLSDEWLDRFETHPLRPVALLVRADATYRGGDEYEALFDYEAIARLYPGNEAYVTALQRELEIGTKYARGLNRKFFGMRLVDAGDIGEELLIRVQERLPGSNLAEAAGMELGDFYFRQSDMTLAATAYELFIDNYPNSPRLSTARKRLIAANLATHKGPQWDAAGLINARVQLQQMKFIEPAAAQQIGADAMIAGIDERMARKMLVTAEFYLSVDDPIAAEYTIRRMLRRYERTSAAAEALRRIPAILDRLSDNLREEVAPFYAQKREAMLAMTSATTDAAPVSDEAAEGGRAAAGEEEEQDE